MSKVAVHIRIANLNPTDDEVISRKQAISILTAAWRDFADLGSAIEKASEIAGALGGNGQPTAKLGEEVERTIQNAAPAYLYRERPLDVGVCAGLTALTLVAAEDEKTGKSVVDVFAATLWSALSYQPKLEDARREALREELMEACRKRCSETAEAGREREDVDEFGQADEEEEGEGEGEDNIVNEVKEAASNAISSLKRNAILDREELNFLWWALLNRSRLLNRLQSAIQEPVRLVASAIEGAQYLSALPSEVHRDLVLRTLDVDPSFTHEGLLKKIGADREQLDIYGEVGIVDLAPGAFPMLHSLKVGKATRDGSAVSRPSSEWASRALLEAAIAQLYLNASE